MTWNHEQNLQKIRTLLLSENWGDRQLRKKRTLLPDGTVDLGAALEKFRNSIGDHSDCWNWTGRLNQAGYGRMAFQGKMQRAHRVSYILFVSEAPDDLCVCHRCDNPKCVNPDHLFLGTKNDNNQDKVQKGRQPNGIVHWNHRYAPEIMIEARALRSDGKTYSEIQSILGLSHKQVEYILTGRRALKELGRLVPH